MTPADLDAIERDALRDAPRCAACGALATRICRGCCNVWCGAHNSSTKPAQCCDTDDMEPLPEDARLAMARALREAWQERDSLNDARNVLTDAVATLTAERDAARSRAWAIGESRDETRTALDAMTHDRNEANRQRVVAHKALDAVAALLFVPLRDLGYDRAAEVLCAHVEELYQQRTAARNEEYAHAAAHARADALQAKVATLTQERDAAIAAVDAVRADYAPRREPPTADEVRAVSRLWGNGLDAQVVCVGKHGCAVVTMTTSKLCGREYVGTLTTGGLDALHAADGWLAIGPTGPVAWSELAALVRGGDR